MSTHSTIALIGTFGLAFGAFGAVGATDTTEPAPVIDPGDGGDYAPIIDPGNFVDVIDNPYLPYAVGSRWVYEGQSEGEMERIEVEVLDDTREVMGITATVVRDTVFVDDEMVEDTYDWFAQDADGNVWYLGEDTREFEDGVAVNAEGAWEGGIDGALPGIVMPADPTVGDAFRQEYYAGEAEDMAEITEVGVARSIGIGDYDDVVVMTHWTPLEPEVIEEKWYARDVGTIYEEAVAGGDELVELVEFTPGEAVS
jgi:hypothetical protein